MNGDINPYTRKEVSKEGRVLFLAGTTGTGKTTFEKEKLRKITLPKYIFDIDNEFNPEFHKEIINRQIPLDESAEKFKIKVAPLWESAIVFAEAGIFFQHGANDLYMREILKSARRRGNWLLFDFHSISEIPVGMLKFCNYLVIKKTVMETREQLNKFKHYREIIDAYKKVMASKNIYETEIINPRTLNVDF